MVRKQMVRSHMKPASPFFLTFEGGEGAGKTTLIQKVADALSSHGLSVVVTREPGGSALGEKVRKLLLNDQEEAPIFSMAELLLFLAARAQNLEETIIPALKQGKIVLCDRFNDSTIAYQGAGRSLGVSRVQLLCELACRGVAPDLTLFLDVDPSVGIKRTLETAKENAQRGKVDRIEAEAISFHQTVRKAFLDIALQSPERFKIIDANQSREAVFEQAMNVINTSLSHV